MFNTLDWLCIANYVKFMFTTLQVCGGQWPSKGESHDLRRQGKFMNIVFYCVYVVCLIVCGVLVHAAAQS